MFTKIVVVVIFLGILASLGSGLLFLIKGSRADDNMLKALTWRIGLSVGLFALLFILFAVGLIQPHGVQG